MGITVQFESYEEMIGFANKLVGGKTPVEAAKKETKVTKPAKEETPAQDEETQRAEDQPYTEEAPAQEEETVVTYTLEQVRAKLTQLTRSGKAKEVKAILTSVKAANLTSVDPKDYATVMEKAGDL
jgi:hypothetical protein